LEGRKEKGRESKGNTYRDGISNDTDSHHGEPNGREKEIHLVDVHVARSHRDQNIWSV
jgi:hypothetical protein